MAPQDGTETPQVLVEDRTEIPKDDSHITKAGIDPSPLSKTPYDFSRQKLNEIINLLRHCGTEGLVRLPKIAVIGNQSAGKSSLIEAIAQIKVPRASGTCTRCPMEFVLSRAEELLWSCEISLRFDHSDLSGGTNTGTHSFAKTDLKENVPILLRRAQLAILNPGQPFENFLNLDDAQCTQHGRTVNFSQNTVVMEIKGGDVDVTFIDLPGIISNTETVKSFV
jgi:vacuolar protein sorting-associated protein 1